MPQKKENINQLKERLDHIIEALESGDLDIEVSVAKYEEAVKLISIMQQQLKELKNKVEKIDRAFPAQEREVEKDPS
ncbi:MAG: exodeoxyribonuclease VII small subunit [Candidatus Kerfeldbacteria bacterium RIFCSPHIGHO2_02_FULL_42_14]|uniref:Exodeoxyribonuclease VII small subunit n=1 Tax=Candidatus Kerfeldbacteria bacterium RIFCSPHIGHO2_02_FULL_42_14 TaxID=1798540 RepID=A0A1G2AQT2_9BACT|nr:MAG: exodeoxyribonuclease VII small subunit [Candidatus Kerfeldbacteria bacterium RIFCSPHIGHO2_02_FULL_42_14]OGY81314.1 MAG: exodeoxyribonuclease VII small subunit [Candidatus Kerfeldbacteria bacterium RIFCSPHIGHO2_12_FULL_42_13]OGY83588.1 MAG: exodeoxyribonuclease VII small subunit [Candidatus Kerfeldbacteria bacterium RIFCSPLOWO2_02_FULL_42_19]OGY86698.1 MAG: exodeoxyribonuclease VII small subunit [Candidatus Kerfeldbacteria bacterium RIFCSPLOWO2_12_FULL_43_9]